MAKNGLDNLDCGRRIGGGGSTGKVEDIPVLLRRHGSHQECLQVMKVFRSAYILQQDLYKLVSPILTGIVEGCFLFLTRRTKLHQICTRLLLLCNHLFSSLPVSLTTRAKKANATCLRRCWLMINLFFVGRGGEELASLFSLDILFLHHGERNARGSIWRNFLLFLLLFHAVWHVHGRVVGVEKGNDHGGWSEFALLVPVQSMRKVWEEKRFCFWAEAPRLTVIFTHQSHLRLWTLKNPFPSFTVTINCPTGYPVWLWFIQ